jgi:hypothetical protein
VNDSATHARVSVRDGLPGAHCERHKPQSDDGECCHEVNHSTRNAILQVFSLPAFASENCPVIHEVTTVTLGTIPMGRKIL